MENTQKTSIIDELLLESAKVSENKVGGRYHSLMIEDLEFGANGYVVVDYEKNFTTINYDYWTEKSVQYPLTADEMDKDKLYQTTSLSTLLRQAIESASWEEANVIAEAIFKGVMDAYFTSCCDKEVAFDALRELKDICDNTVYKIPFEFYDEEDDFIEKTNNVNLERLTRKNAPMAEAIIAGDLQLIKFLVEEIGLDVSNFEKVRGKMRNPLEIVAENDGYVSKEIVDYLVAQGAQPTPYALRRAVKWGNVELAKLFIELGADANRVVEGETALDICLRIATKKKSMIDTLVAAQMMMPGAQMPRKEVEVCKNVDKMLTLLIENGAKTAEEIKTAKIPVVRKVATLKKNVKAKLARKQAAKRQAKTEDTVKTV